MIYEIIVFYKRRIAYRFSSTKINDILRVIENLSPGFTWAGTMSAKP